MRTGLKRKTTFQGRHERVLRPQNVQVWPAPSGHVWGRSLGCLRREWRSLQRLGPGAAHSPLTAGMSPLCALTMVRGPDGVFARCVYLGVEQGSLARSHAPAWRDQRACEDLGTSRNGGGACKVPLAQPFEP